MADIKNHSTLPTNLVSYWDLEEASGTRYDLVGSNHLTDNNTVLNTTGKIGNGADFEASNSEYLSHSDNAELSITGDWSASFWFKPETATSGCIFSKWHDTGPNRGILVLLAATGDIRIYVSPDPGTTFPSTLFNTNLSAGTWYHLVICFDASASSVSVYKDGTLVATQSGYGTNVYDNTADFKLGAYNASSAPVDGVLDEFGIWSKVLTTDEVSDLYNSGDGLPYEAAPVNAVKSINGLSNV